MGGPFSYFNTYTWKRPNHCEAAGRYDVPNSKRAKESNSTTRWMLKDLEKKSRISYWHIGYLSGKEWNSESLWYCMHTSLLQYTLHIYIKSICIYIGKTHRKYLPGVQSKLIEQRYAYLFPDILSLTHTRERVAHAGIDKHSSHTIIYIMSDSPVNRTSISSKWIGFSAHTSSYFFEVFLFPLWDWKIKWSQHINQRKGNIKCMCACKANLTQMLRGVFYTRTNESFEQSTYAVLGQKMMVAAKNAFCYSTLIFRSIFRRNHVTRSLASCSCHTNFDKSSTQLNV